MPVDIRRRRLRRDEHDEQTTSINSHDTDSDNLENIDNSDVTTMLSVDVDPDTITDTTTTLADIVTGGKVRPYPVTANNQNGMLIILLLFVAKLLYKCFVVVCF